MFLLSGTRIIPGTLSGIATTKNSKSKGNGAGGVGGNRLIFRYYRLTTCGWYWGAVSFAYLSETQMSFPLWDEIRQRQYLEKFNMVWRRTCRLRLIYTVHCQLRGYMNRYLTSYTVYTHWLTLTVVSRTTIISASSMVTIRSVFR